MATKNNFATADIGLATALTCYGFPYKVNRENPKRVLFEFEQSERLQNSVSEYWNKGLLIPALEMIETLRNLKTRIYAGQ